MENKIAILESNIENLKIVSKKIYLIMTEECVLSKFIKEHKSNEPIIKFGSYYNNWLNEMHRLQKEESKLKQEINFEQVYQKSLIFKISNLKKELKC